MIFPAEHWKHIRTTNPIESTFSTVRLRTAKVRGCFSSKTVLTMAFQLCRCAQKKWQRLSGYKKLEKDQHVTFIETTTDKGLQAQEVEILEAETETVTAKADVVEETPVKEAAKETKTKAVKKTTKKTAKKVDEVKAETETGD